MGQISTDTLPEFWSSLSPILAHLNVSFSLGILYEETLPTIQRNDWSTSIKDRNKILSVLLFNTVLEVLVNAVRIKWY